MSIHTFVCQSINNLLFFRLVAILILKKKIVLFRNKNQLTTDTLANQHIFDNPIFEANVEDFKELENKYGADY